MLRILGQDPAARRIQRYIDVTPSPDYVNYRRDGTYSFSPPSAK